MKTDYTRCFLSLPVTLPWCCSLVPVGLGVRDTLGSILRLELSEADTTRRCGDGMGAIGTSVTYVAGTYNGFVLLAAPILRTCQRTNRFPKRFCYLFLHKSTYFSQAATSTAEGWGQHGNVEHCSSCDCDRGNKQTHNFSFERQSQYLFSTYLYGL